MYSQGYINNSQTFEFGVMTTDGYMGINITDPNAFNSFFNATNSFGLLEFYYEFYKLMIDNSTPHAINHTIDKFAAALNKMFTEQNMGLSASYKPYQPYDNKDDWYYYDKKTKTMKKC